MKLAHRRAPDVWAALFGGALLVALLTACASPEEGTDWAPRLAVADSIVSEWIDAGRVPGAVLRVEHDGRALFERAYGFANVADSVPMTPETVFDLASVTKVAATTLAVMVLVDEGRLEVDAPVTRYLPDFADGDDRAEKASITLRHLLTHRAGLYQWRPTYYHAGDADQAYAYVRDLPLAWPVGAERHYSDLGFMLLGRVVEHVAGTPLDVWVEERLYRPLGLTSIGYRRASTHGAGGGATVSPGHEAPTPGRFAATSHGNPFERRMVHDPDFGYRIEGDPNAWSGWRDHVLEGEVNDGNAYHAFDGVAGHAGLFSDAEDLAVVARVVLDPGASGGGNLVGEEVVRRFLTSSGDDQALGWQLPPYAPPGSFGHTGFTGTFVLGVPSQDLVIVLLTNRQNFGVDENTTYPDVGPLQRAVTAALTSARPRRP